MLTVQHTDAIRRIEAAIDYTFRDKRLLVQVFTRKTFMKIDPEAPDNEVLEFYGDMLLSYHVTTYFVEKFAHMLDDGLYFMRTVEQFTEMRSHYVRNQYLTERIKQLIPSIDRLLRAQNPKTELPKDNQKVYADLFESLVGAVYLDSCCDDKLIRTFILRHLNIEPKACSAPRKSASTVVLPSVSLVSDEADDPLIAALEEPAIMVHLPDKIRTDGIPPATDNQPAEPTPSIESPAETTITEAANMPLQDNKRAELEAFCLAAGFDLPTYGETPPNAPNARPVAACTLRYRDEKGKPVKISLNDSGKTLEEATEKAAAKMLRKLMQQKPVSPGKDTTAPVPDAVTTAEPIPAETSITPTPTEAPIEAAVSGNDPVAVETAADLVKASSAEETASPARPKPRRTSKTTTDETPKSPRSSRKASNKATAQATDPGAIVLQPDPVIQPPASEPDTANRSTEAVPAPEKKPTRARTRNRRIETPEGNGVPVPESAADSVAAASSASEAPKVEEPVPAEKKPRRKTTSRPKAAAPAEPSVE